jgi:TRAP-type C4-dicarboxylate transport system permease large subunit
LCLPCLPWPTQQLVVCPTFHVSHAHPPLATRRLNTAKQVNNMNAWHLMYNRDIFITQYFYIISLLILLPHFWAGQMAPEYSCREQDAFTAL